MSKDQIVEILGNPDSIHYSVADSSEYELIYFPKNERLKSDLPTVGFDSTNKVIYAVYLGRLHSF